MTSPGAASTRRYDMADNVRTALAQTALDLGVSLPTEQYITTGQADHDCPQVAFIVTSVRTGLPPAGQIANGVTGAGGPMLCDPAWSMMLGIEIVRSCAPVPGRNSGIVPKNKFEDASRIASADVELFTLLPRYVAEYQFANFDCTISLPPITGGFQVVKAMLTVSI